MNQLYKYEYNPEILLELEEEFENEFGEYCLENKQKKVEIKQKRKFRLAEKRT